MSGASMFKSGSSKRIILPIAVILLCGGVSLALSSLKKAPEEKDSELASPIVSIEHASFAPLDLIVQSQGVVEAKFETELVAQVSGELVYLDDAFVRGGFVRKGQLLARIDPSDYETQVLEAEANLQAAKAGYEIEKAQAHVAEVEWRRANRSDPSELSLRKPQLAQELSRVRAAEASLKRAKRNLERTFVKAPYDALVGGRNVAFGSFVQPGLSLGVVKGVERAEVRLPVADDQLKYLRKRGINADVNLRAKFAGEFVVWQAKIVRSEGDVNRDSRMNYLVAEVLNPYQLTVPEAKSELNTPRLVVGKSLAPENIVQNESLVFTQSDAAPLRFGTYVTADITGLHMPSASVVRDYMVNDGKIAVYEDDKLRFKAVDIIRRDAGRVVIASGINEGDKLITSSISLPLEGMALRLAESAEPSEQNALQDVVGANAE